MDTHNPAHPILGIQNFWTPTIQPIRIVVAEILDGNSGQNFWTPTIQSIRFVAAEILDTHNLAIRFVVARVLDTQEFWTPTIQSIHPVPAVSSNRNERSAIRAIVRAVQIRLRTDNAGSGVPESNFHKKIYLQRSQKRWPGKIAASATTAQPRRTPADVPRA